MPTFDAGQGPRPRLRVSPRLLPPAVEQGRRFGLHYHSPWPPPWRRRGGGACWLGSGGCPLALLSLRSTAFSSHPYPSPAYKAEGLVKGFGDRLLIDGLTFSLPAGGIVGVGERRGFFAPFVVTIGPVTVLPLPVNIMPRFRALLPLPPSSPPSLFAWQLAPTEPESLLCSK